MPEWKNYLQNASLRLGKQETTEQKGRTSFQRDYDRIIFHDAFRRLQNKTQVFPIPESEVIRNRLTHSLETASVGRSLGYLAGQAILEKYPGLREETGLTADDFSYIVSAAALAHDIGNPPFGHQGEEAISFFFKSAAAEPYLKNLDDKQKADLQCFEGNAAGFRILAATTDPRSQIRGGLRLNLATYGAFVKYPKEVLPNRKSEGRVSLKKYGFFQAEKETFQLVAEQLRLIPQHTEGGRAWKRYPLAFLTEAADDICYNVIDYEDGYHLGLITFKQIEEKFTALAQLNGEQQQVYRSISDEKQKISFLRAHVINVLIKELANIFVENEEAIREGEYDRLLWKDLPEERAEILKEIAVESLEKLYHNELVLKKEAAGKTVIPFLLEKFLAAVFNPKELKQYYMLIPPSYRQNEDDYLKILDVVMYVSGMSDRQAVELYRNFIGIRLP